MCTTHQRHDIPGAASRALNAYHSRAASRALNSYHSRAVAAAGRV